MGRSSTARTRLVASASRRIHAARALLAYFQGALLLAKTNNDASIIDALADQALSLVAGTPLESR